MAMMDRESDRVTEPWMNEDWELARREETRASSLGQPQAGDTLRHRTGRSPFRKPLVYLAGPITSNPYGCVRQATEAATLLRDAGVVCFLPQLSVIHQIVSPQPYEDWMTYDFDIIRHCDAVVRLPGESLGADREVVFAREIGVMVWGFPEDLAMIRDWAEKRKRLAI